MYRIAWKYIGSDVIHYGQFCNDIVLISTWIEYMNKNYCNLHLWIDYKQKDKA